MPLLVTLLVACGQTPEPTARGRLELAPQTVPPDASQDVIDAIVATEIARLRSSAIHDAARRRAPELPADLQIVAEPGPGFAIDIGSTLANAELATVACNATGAAWLDDRAIAAYATGAKEPPLPRFVTACGPVRPSR